MKKMLLIAVVFFSLSKLIASHETEFDIKFKSGVVTPLVTTDFESVLTRLDTEKGDTHVFRVIQFYDIPTSADKKRITESGIELLSYIPNNAFYAKLPVTIKGERLSELNIRSMFALQPHQKISPQLQKGELPEWAVKGNMIELDVKCYAGQNIESVIQFVTNNGGRVIFQLKKANAMTIRFKASEIDILADNPLVQWIEPISPSAVPDGTVSNNTIRQNAINTSYLGGRKYDGTGVVVGISDDGMIGPHIDMKGRVFMETTSNDGNHGDNSSGVFAGAGNLNPLGEGAAPGVDLHVFSHIPNSSLESHTQIVNGEQYLEDYNMVISSTSWSQAEGGIYNVSSEFGDQQIYDNQMMMHVFSAGNEGDNDHGYGAGPGWANITGGYKAGKNVICVGNLDSNGDLVNNSGRGPALDGRIKPDICAQGNGSFTTDEDNTYTSFGGTSAAAPAVAGVFTQLYQAYKVLNDGDEPETALIKAAILNTGKDGGNPGPDFQYGWGQINGLKAVRILEENRYMRDSIDQAGSNTHSITVPENVSEVRIMVYWTDLGGDPSADIALVNDIDMQVVAPDAVTYNPWVLDHSPTVEALDADAVRGEDHLNNMEQVSISNPASGEYTVNLAGYAIPEGPQVYYVVYDFIYNGLELTYPIGGEGFVPGETEVIRWDASEGTDDISLEYSIDGGVSYTTISNSISSSASGYNWTVPNEVSGNVKMRISRGSEVNESDTTFTIVDVPQNIDFLRLCPDSMELAWDPVPGATSYEVSVLGEKYMDSLGVSSTNSLVFAGFNPLEPHWFSVRSVVDGGKGRRAIAIYQAPEILNCNLNVDVAVTEILNNPSEFTPCGDLNENVISVLITNDGANDITDDFEISYQLSGEDIVTEIYSGTLLSGEQDTYNFIAPLELPSAGIFDLVVSVDLTDDENEFNDTASISFFGSLQSTALPFSEGFETGGVPPFGWTINNADEDLTWETKYDITGADGGLTTAAHTNNYWYDAAGEIDELVTEYFDLTDLNTASLSFDVAKAQYSANYQDGLRVEVSTDCGESFTEIYYKDDLELSTLSSYSTANQWEPASSEEWRNEVIDLAPYLGEILLFKFISVCGYGNSLYIDNINLDGTVGLDEVTIADFTVSPNPANETININLNNISDVNASLMIMNSIGQVIVANSSVNGAKMKQIDVSNFSSGLYFIVVSSDGAMGTKKLIVE